MKKIYALFSCILIGAAINLCFTACDKDDNIVRQEVILEVDSEPGDYYIYGVPVGEPQPGMYIKAETGTSWKVISQQEITGFNYEQGYYYKLLVQISTKKTNELGQRPTYKLLKELEKEPSESRRK